MQEVVTKQEKKQEFHYESAYLIAHFNEVDDVPVTLGVYSERYPTIIGNDIINFLVSKLDIKVDSSNEDDMFYGPIADLLERMLENGDFDTVTFTKTKKQWTIKQCREYLGTKPRKIRKRFI